MFHLVSWYVSKWGPVDVKTENLVNNYRSISGTITPFVDLYPDLGPGGELAGRESGSLCVKPFPREKSTGNGTSLRVKTPSSDGLLASKTECVLLSFPQGTQRILSSSSVTEM